MQGLSTEGLRASPGLPPLRGEAAPAPVQPLLSPSERACWPIAGVTDSRTHEPGMAPSGVLCQETQVVGTGVNWGVYATTKGGSS